MTACGRVALARAVVVPTWRAAGGCQVRQEAETLCAPADAGQHRLVEVPADGLLECCGRRRAQTGVRLSTDEVWMRTQPPSSPQRRPVATAPDHDGGAWLMDGQPGATARSAVLPTTASLSAAYD